MRRCILAFAMVVTFALPAHAADGLETLQSPHSVAETADRLVAALEQKGMTVFARIDHAGGAEDVGLELAPTELVIFGNPKVGTLLMQCSHTAAIDLPMKALIWEDADGQVQIGYNQAEWLAQRHGASECEVVPKIQKALQGFAEAATAKQ